MFTLAKDVTIQAKKYLGNLANEDYASHALDTFISYLIRSPISVLQPLSLYHRAAARYDYVTEIWNPAAGPYSLATDLTLALGGQVWDLELWKTVLETFDLPHEERYEAACEVSLTKDIVRDPQVIIQGEHKSILCKLPYMISYQLAFSFIEPNLWQRLKQKENKTLG